MKNKILTLSLIVLFALSTLTLITSVQVKAQTPSPTNQWITNYTIADSSGNVIMSSSGTGSGYITASEELVVTVTINVATSDPSSSLTLTTAMGYPTTENYYWSHNVSNSYNLGTSYNPNSASISFPQNAGTLQISCYGQAQGQVATTVGSVTIHIPVPTALITLSDPSGATLAAVNANVTDSSINNYNTQLKAAENKLSSLQSSNVDPGYVQVYQNVIQQSETVANEGLTDQATAMLNGLSSTAAPASAGTTFFYIPLVVVFAVIAGIFGFMFMRTRSKTNYFRLVVEDQIKDLEGLTLRASKLDRTMASNLDSVKERLKRLVGM